MRKRDYTGEKFNRLTAIRPVAAEEQQRHKKWVFQCDCGKEYIAYIDNVVGGKTKSCGCLFHEQLVERNYKHGFPKDRLYIIWKTMRQRCNNPKKDHFDRYGGRGIKYAPEWEEYPPFREWALNNGYAENLTLDRIDNDGDYTPENCRWVTQKQQMNNVCYNVKLEIDGVSRTITAWSQISGRSYGIIRRRLSKGLSPKEAVFGE